MKQSQECYTAYTSSSTGRKILQCKGVTFTRVHVTQLSQAIMQLKPQEVHIQSCQIGPKGWKQLVEAMKQNDKLLSLIVSYFNLSTNDLRILLEMILCSSRFEELCLTGVGLDNEKLALIFTTLSQQPSLSKLFLPANEFNAEGLKAILDFIPTSLEELDLSSNCIGEVGYWALLRALSLPKYLNREKYLRTLCVSNTDILPEAFEEGICYLENVNFRLHELHHDQERALLKRTEALMQRNQAQGLLFEGILKEIAGLTQGVNKIKRLFEKMKGLGFPYFERAVDALFQYIESLGVNKEDRFFHKLLIELGEEVLPSYDQANLVYDRLACYLFAVFYRYRQNLAEVELDNQEMFDYFYIWVTAVYFAVKGRGVKSADLSLQEHIRKFFSTWPCLEAIDVRSVKTQDVVDDPLEKIVLSFSNLVDNFKLYSSHPLLNQIWKRLKAASAAKTVDEAIAIISNQATLTNFEVYSKFENLTRAFLRSPFVRLTSHEAERISDDLNRIDNLVDAICYLQKIRRHGMLLYYRYRDGQRSPSRIDCKFFQPGENYLLRLIQKLNHYELAFYDLLFSEYDEFCFNRVLKNTLSDIEKVFSFRSSSEDEKNSDSLHHSYSERDAGSSMRRDCEEILPKMEGELEALKNGMAYRVLLCQKRAVERFVRWLYLDSEVVTPMSQAVTPAVPDITEFDQAVTPL